MTITYIDTSAALKLLVDEPGTSELDEHLAENRDDLVSSMLLHVELHCAAQRRAQIDPVLVQEILDGIDLVSQVDNDLVYAAAAGWGLRSADAIHLAVAIRVRAERMLTFDRELGEAAAQRAGLEWLLP